jgi:hypothetical protein
LKGAVISQTAIDVVTDAANMSSFGDAGIGVQAVRTEAVVDELERLEGVDAGEARQLARDAIAHIGGQIEVKVGRRGLAAGRVRRQVDEWWWVPRSTIRS